MKNSKIFVVLSFILVFSIISISYQPVVGKSDEYNGSNFDDLLFKLKIKFYLRFLKFPSMTFCVLKNDSIVFSGAFGHSHVYLRKKADLDTIYVIGSNSKSITATAIMQLIENKSYGLSLDDNISKYLPFDIKNPNFPNVNITFRMLLAHQSSLNDPTLDLRYIFPLEENITKWIKERLVQTGKHWGDYPPGEDIWYSNTGFILTSLLVEEISGVPFEKYCKKNIFEPLKMYNTSFDLIDLDKKSMARPSFHIFGKLYLPLFHYDAKCVSACGGVRTTAVDLSHFLLAHMNNGTYGGVRILKNETIEEMHKVQYYNFTSNFYGGILQHGLGWMHLNLSGDMWEGYNGGAFGYSCNMMVLQKSNTGIIILANGNFNRPRGVISNKICLLKIDMLYKMANELIKKAEQ